MRRRKVITLLGGTMAWPLAARAQQPDRTRLVGVLMGFAESDPVAQSMVAAFRTALSKLGWTEGSNVRIELRWAGPDPDRMNTMAKELADLRPDAILGQTTPVVRGPCPRDADKSYCVCHCVRSNRQRLRQKPRTSGRQHHGFTVDDSALGGKWVELLKQIARYCPCDAAVQSGWPATPILLAFNSSRRILLKRPGERCYNSCEG